MDNKRSEGADEELDPTWEPLGELGVRVIGKIGARLRLGKDRQPVERERETPSRRDEK